MHPDIIKESLSLASVTGVALIQKTAVPYFCVKDSHFNGQQQNTLACLIGNVIESTASNLKAFEFQVMDYHAYAYPLQPQVTFIILAQQPDVRIKLLGVHKWQSVAEHNTDRFVSFFKEVEQAHKQKLEKDEAHRGADSGNPGTDTADTIEALLHKLNSLSQSVSKFLGPQLTANYWGTSRPAYEWLEKFEITPLAEITFTGDCQALTIAINHLCIRQWTNAFMKQCSQIIQDLPRKIEQDQIRMGQRQTLSIVPIGTLTKLANLEPQEGGLFWD